MKWAFIDYENIGCLSKLDLSIYKKVIIFVGAKQPKIDFGEKKYEKPINIVIIQIKATHPNNLDFHLSYYLGKYDNEASQDIEFEVISNDSGFSPLISHIKANGRKCKQTKVTNASNEITKLIHSIKSRPIEKRPKKILSLRNHIAAHLKIQGNEVAIQNNVNQLVNLNILSLSEDGIKYKC